MLSWYLYLNFKQSLNKAQKGHTMNTHQRYGTRFPFIIQAILACFFPGFRQYLNDLEKIIKEADHDPLTQLKNRRSAQELFDRELSLLLREDRNRGIGVPVTAVFIDLDGFSTINDAPGLGHAAGDQVLVHIAELLTGSFRTSDIICRNGGDEFIVFLINAEEEQALKHVQQLFDAIQHDERLTLTQANGEAIRVTASIGVASSYVRSTTTLKDAWALLMKRADEAMYASKDGGKNAVEVVRVTAFGSFE